MMSLCIRMREYDAEHRGANVGITEHDQQEVGEDTTRLRRGLVSSARKGGPCVL